MSAFVAGIVFGGLLTAAVFFLIIGRVRRPRRREPIEWEEDYFEDELQPPPVTTRILIKERNYQL